MIGLQNISLRAMAILLLLAVTLGFAGVNHRAPTLQDNAMQAFALAGFAPSDLCGSDDPTGKEHAARCLACTTPAQAVIPPVVCVARTADFQFVATISAPRERKFVAAVQDPAHWKRGPPLV